MGKGLSARWSADDVAKFARRGRAAQSAVNEIINQVATRSAMPPRLSPMNRLEAAYAQRLELERLAGMWQWWAYEPIKLRLAGGAWYTPDFALLDPGGHLIIHETKGHWREAARVRIKVAAELYPFFRFVAVTRQRKREGGNWIFTPY